VRKKKITTTKKKKKKKMKKTNIRPQRLEANGARRQTLSSAAGPSMMHDVLYVWKS